ncbi:P-loop containing nucleoside triphosphate hydrolase protein [Aureobasidium sp. EXF-10727]|nr:P-loop containing nucleoside triphosphate hydrolase protein [Aureobasidium sp. EXF-10727]
MEPQEVSILLLGDADVGKTTFLSILCFSSDAWHPYHDLTDFPSRLALGPTSSSSALPVLRDLDQPFTFELRGRTRPYTLEFYDTSSPTSYTLLRPNLILLCFSIPSRDSLMSLKGQWKNIVETHFNYDESIPVIVLGLQRDLRRENVDGMVFPQEALRVAAEMRCDRYCECSAVTGELCAEVWEDIVRTAVATTTNDGGRSEPPSCIAM